jgi:hypothetical protein
MRLGAAMHRQIVAFILFLSLSCTSGSSNVPSVVAATADVRRGGQLTLVHIEPEIGSALTEESIVHVIVDYSIFGMDAGAHYGIMPVFSDKAGAGRGFITKATLEEVGELRTGNGRADLRFRVKPAWRDPRFARPPSISFHLVMQYPESGIDALAEVGPFSYQ